MTRLLGLQGAQPYILESRLFNPREALELGLVHELAPDATTLRAAAEAYIATHESAQHPWDAKNYKMPGGTPATPKIAGMLSVAPAVLKQKTRGLYPAPEAALAAMVEGALVDYDTALRIESRYLAQLIVSPVARNMITAFFFHMNAIKGGGSRPADVPKFKPKKVGILGAGMMGAGIAYAQASRGIDTVLEDVSLENAELGRAYSLRVTQPRVEKGQMSVVAQQALLARITPTDHAKDLQGCELIIEAVTENRDVKAQVTREAEAQLAPGGFMASNTSTLPITSLAKAVARPEKFVGIHFFSPVDKMKLVEIIRGQKTDDETIARAYDYVQAFGTFVMEGATMLGEGVPAPVIENAAVQAGMPVGPLAVLDETALSLAVHVLDQTRADFKAEGKVYEPGSGELLVERMVKTLRRAGRHAGGGFYDYPPGQRKHLWPELKGLFEDPQLAWSLQDVKDRLLYRQSVETVRCLAEGVLTTAHDANIGSIFGIGFPAWTGGALQFVYGQGIEVFEKRCDELARRFGQGFLLDGAARDAIRRFAPQP
jgi:3-hydroxyacyl-CoA dehydrogenase/enoyl-CoA hydratase/3-hydroxybutyryl-CoA epimerase